jgi:hypothetical protein
MIGETRGGGKYMAASQVVLYFDKQEDAVQFTLAASSVLSAEEPAREALTKIAQEISKASRIRTEADLQRSTAQDAQPQGQCA